MSGGQYDYFFYKLEELKIDKIDSDIRRACVQKVIDALAKAMYDIEWVDSGDRSPGDEYTAIDELLAILGGDPVTIMKAAAFDRMRDLFNQEALSNKGTAG